MATENPWRARRIQAELEKLGIKVGLATVSRYLPKGGPDEEQRQRWMTFLRNHRDALSAMDLLLIPTVRFKRLYVWFEVGHKRRVVINCRSSKEFGPRTLFAKRRFLVST